MDEQRQIAASWFRELRDRITAAFEGLEDQAPALPQPDGSR